MSSNLLPPNESLLTYLAIDPAAIRAISPPWKRTHYQAILNWLIRHQPKPNAPNLEQVRGCLEAISLFCDLEDWAQAEKILMICLNTPTNEELHNQLATWGYYREQIQLYERFLDQSDPLLKALCLSGLGNAWDRLGNYGQAIYYHQQCLILAQQLNLSEVEGKALCNLGNAYFSLNDYTTATQLYKQHLNFAQASNDRLTEGIALGNLGNVYRVQENYPKALEYLQQRLAIAQEIGDFQGEENAFGNLGMVYLQLKHYEAAIECQFNSLEIARRIGNRSGEGRALGNLGAICRSLGQLAQAVELFESLRKISEEISDREAYQTAIRQLGSLYQSLQNYEQAISFQQEDLIVAKIAGDLVTVGSLLLNLGTSARKINRYDQSIAWHEELLELSRTMEDGDGEKWVFGAMALYGLALVYQKLNDINRAIEYCDQALRLESKVVKPIVERCALLKNELSDGHSLASN